MVVHVDVIQRKAGFPKCLELRPYFRAHSFRISGGGDLSPARRDHLGLTCAIYQFGISLGGRTERLPRDHMQAYGQGGFCRAFPRRPQPRRR